jgi:hypothetical protein
VGKIKNTIKINGHIYDANTGAPISHGAPSAKMPAHKSVDSVTAHRVVAPTAKAIHHKPKTIAVTSERKASPAKTDRTSKTTAHHPVQHSQTLMRHAVKKPSRYGTHHIKAQSHTGALVKNPTTHVEHKSSTHQLDERRLSHAKHVSKSQKISRFSSNALHASTPVATQPAPVVHHPPKPLPKPQPIINHKKTTSDILEQAIKHANSHNQPAPKRRMTRSQRITSFSALTVTTAVLIGIVAVQNLPALKIHIASAKAGFAASMPGYKPAGFHLGQLNYSAGVVAMNYKSNSDQSRKFAVTQKSSSWDSSTLRDIFVEANDKNYKAVEDGGRTVFLYGQNNATWVDHGVWYQVQGSGSLSNRQLVDIAKSL